jgi:hypothetical protein
LVEVLFRSSDVHRLPFEFRVFAKREPFEMIGDKLAGFGEVTFVFGGNGHFKAALSGAQITLPERELDLSCLRVELTLKFVPKVLAKLLARLDVILAVLVNIAVFLLLNP